MKLIFQKDNILFTIFGLNWLRFQSMVYYS